MRFFDWVYRTDDHSYYLTQTMVDRCIFYIILQDLIGTCSQLDRRWQKMTEVNAYVDATSRCIWHHMVTFQVSWIWRRTTQKETGASGCQIASICPFSGCFCSTKETHVFRFFACGSQRGRPLCFLFFWVRCAHGIGFRSSQGELESLKGRCENFFGVLLKIKNCCEEVCGCFLCIMDDALK